MKIKIVSKLGYSEESQPNPLQWLLLKKTGEDEYENVSAWLICKDFFNDLVYTRQTGKSFYIYGFNAGTMEGCLDKNEPVYILVKNLNKSFDDNVGMLNAWLSTQGFPAIMVEKHKGEYLLTFPPIYFINTYYVSLITLIIRLLNYGHKFESFNALTKCMDFPYKDQQKWDKVVEKGVFFNIPKKLQKYVWYAGKEYNDKKSFPEYQLSGLVHNNGVLNWSAYFDA